MSQSDSVDETGEKLRSPAAPRPRGALALAGLWGALDEAALDAVVAEIYVERAREVGRRVAFAE